VKRTLASLLYEYAANPFPYGLCSKLRPLISNPVKVWAKEDTLTILNSGVFLRTSRRRFVRRKWTKWLVPNVFSNTSFGQLFSLQK